MNNYYALAMCGSTEYINCVVVKGSKTGHRMGREM